MIKKEINEAVQQEKYRRRVKSLMHQGWSQEDSERIAQEEMSARKSENTR